MFNFDVKYYTHMSNEDLKRNFEQIFQEIESTGNKRTNLSRLMGYTTTAQLNSVLDGTSMLSTKAIISLIENLNVNPLFLFLGKGPMLLNVSDEDETNLLRKENEELRHNHSEATKTVNILQVRVQELEKSNADLLEMSSAALKYYKSKYENESKNSLEK